MKILDTGGKEREALSVSRVSHTHQDTSGNTISEDYAKAVIKGKSRTWVNWYPIRQFLKLNPNIRI